MEDPNAGSFSQEPLPTTPSPPSGLPPDLQLALATYKTNYAKYQAGGQTQPAHKTAYEAALAVVNEAIATMNNNIKVTIHSISNQITIIGIDSHFVCFLFG
jgi:hypothetical protein